MASVYEKAGKWYLRWKGPDGRWRDQVSTAQSKTEARRLAGELERRAERQRPQRCVHDVAPEAGALSVRARLRAALAQPPIAELA